MPSSSETLVIIGSGPAGWSAATYAARAQLRPLVYEGAISEKNRMSGTLPLGQLALTSEVENYAGFPHGDLGGFLDSALPKERRMMMPPHEGKVVTGPELMELMRQQASNFGTRIVTDDIVKVDFSARPFKLFPAEGGVVEAKCVIVATGASANWLGLPSEEKFKNRGVSACAVCDGALPRFRNKPIVVVGGGDSALQQALVLAPLVRSVTVAVRGQLRARHARIERASGQPNLRFAWNTVVRGLVGIDALEAVQLERVDDGMRTELPCSGLFPFVGLLPATGWLPDTVVRDALGHVVTDRDGRSSLPGLHAVGAARSGGSGDLVGAAGDAAGAIAALARELQR